MEDTQKRQDLQLRINLRRIDVNLTTNRDEERNERTGEELVEETDRPRLRRTRIPPTRVLERRERQRALNERIRDTYYDRINGNYFPMEQIEE